MELTATISSILPTLTGVSAKGEWKKSTVIIEWADGQYKQTLALDNMKNADAFSQLSVGSTYKFYFDVTSRERNGKWFTSAICWKWEAVGGQQPYAAPQQQPYAAPQPQYQQQPMPIGQPQQSPQYQPYNIPGQADNNPF